MLQAHALIADRLRRLNERAADIVIADDAEFVGNAGGLRIAERRRHARVRHRHDDVGRHRGFTRQFGAEIFAHVIDVAAADDGIGAGEIDIFKDAGPRRHRRERLVRLRAILVEDDDFAVLDVAHVSRADDVERAGFRGEDRAAVELAQHQRSDAQRVARADQFLVGETNEGVGAFQLTQAFDEAVDETVAAGARH